MALKIPEAKLLRDDSGAAVAAAWLPEHSVVLSDAAPRHCSVMRPRALPSVPLLLV